MCWLTGRLNSLYCDSNVTHLKDFISGIAFSLGFWRLGFIYFDQNVLFCTKYIWRKFQWGSFILMENTISWTILILWSSQECYKIHSLSRQHRLWLNKQHSSYTRKYIVLILVSSTLQLDPKSMFQIRNSRQKRFTMSMSRALNSFPGVEQRYWIKEAILSNCDALSYIAGLLQRISG